MIITIWTQRQRWFGDRTELAVVWVCAAHDADALLEEATPCGPARRGKWWGFPREPVNSLLFSIAVENKCAVLGTSSLYAHASDCRARRFCSVEHRGNYALRDATI